MEILGTMPKRETIDMVAEEWQDRRNLRFKVRSREGVNSEWYREPFSVISIHDPQPEGFPNKIMPQEGLSKVLYLGFHDFDVLNGRSEDFWDRESMLNPGHTLRELAMTAEHAAQILGIREHGSRAAAGDSLRGGRLAVAFGRDGDCGLPTHPTEQHRLAPHGRGATSAERARLPHGADGVFEMEAGRVVLRTPSFAAAMNRTRGRR